MPGTWNLSPFGETAALQNKIFSHQHKTEGSFGFQVWYVYIYIHLYMTCVYVYCDFQFPAIPSRSLAGSPIVNAHGVICGPNVVLDIGSRGGCCIRWIRHGLVKKGSCLGEAARVVKQPIGVSHWLVGISYHEAVIDCGKTGFSIG